MFALVLLLSLPVVVAQQTAEAAVVVVIPEIQIEVIQVVPPVSIVDQTRQVNVDLVELIAYLRTLEPAPASTETLLTAELIDDTPTAQP